MLIEFRQAAPRAQTQHTENSTRPGIYKGSLINVSEAATESPPPTAVPAIPQHGRAGRQSESRQRLEALFDNAPLAKQTPDEPPGDLPATGPASRRGRPTGQDRHTFFPREFHAPIPDEVADAISRGTYFLRAWREYRQYKPRDAAELMGLKVVTITCHEQGYNTPTSETLKRFADIYDCTLEQLTAKPDSRAVNRTVRATQIMPIKSAPIDTDYPDSVIDHIRTGKSPVTAWRIYRRMTDKQLAEQFGTSETLLQKMIKAEHLSDKTLRKFGRIFHCTEDQLRRPDGLVVEPHKVKRPALRGQAHDGVQVAAAM